MYLKKGDFYWLLGLGLFILILVVPYTHAVFMEITTKHPFVGGFVKFGILATMGELLAIRITTGDWSIPKGVFYRALIWGFLGMVITLVFQVYGAGVKAAIASGLIPGKQYIFTFAFLTSVIMNMTFAPTMMAFHRLTDTYIDMKYQGEKRITINDVVAKVEWGSFFSFVVVKTIPLFWIPAHTITFLLPPEYRVLAAAFLSIALGGILAFGKRKKLV